ncbi:hypothetical protein ACB092_05G083700, partial [Castanea dentata]
PCNHLFFIFIQIYPYYKLVKRLRILLYTSLLLKVVKKFLTELFLHLLPTLDLDFATSLARNLQLFPPSGSSPFKANSD